MASQHTTARSSWRIRDASVLKTEWRWPAAVQPLAEAVLPLSGIARRVWRRSTFKTSPRGGSRSWMKRPVSCWRWPCSFENLERQRGGICSANGFSWITTRSKPFMRPCSIHRRRCLFRTGPRLTATGRCRPVLALFQRGDAEGDSRRLSRCVNQIVITWRVPFCDARYDIDHRADDRYIPGPKTVWQNRVCIATEQETNERTGLV